MPLFFASNAIYPLAIMPGWLRAVAQANPLTYLVDRLRAAMTWQSVSQFGLATDFGPLLALLATLTLVGARLYPGLAH